MAVSNYQPEALNHTFFRRFLEKMTRLVSEVTQPPHHERRQTRSLEHLMDMFPLLGVGRLQVAAGRADESIGCSCVGEMGGGCWGASRCAHGHEQQ